ncbi:MAG: ferric reductase-like transmembrane domain-containing protein, partial [Deltaproteobacteria bacterium]|nr:ferric reductase-like transmembrane domain-containing protein [Deltaproteobacteria bacterium]
MSTSRPATATATATALAEPAAIAAPRLPLVDGRFAKRFVLACGIVPGLLLAWDAYRGNLGVNEVNFAIRTTGLLGLVFLTLSLVITPLRRLTGWTALIAVRRNLGVYGFAYVAAHFAIFFLFDRDASVTSTLDEIVSRVYLWFGAGSLVLMIPLVITSTDAMVARVGARRWKQLHRLAYLAVLGGVVHYYLLVKADLTRPIVFAAVFGGLMTYRLVRHYLDLRAELRTTHAKLLAARQASAAQKRRPFWSGELRVARIFQETPDVKTFRLVAPDGGPLPFAHTPGQYLNLALTIGGTRVNRSYTIASSPTRAAYCEISVKRAADGYASAHLHDTLVEGSLLKVSAPAGRFGFIGHEAERVVLIAGGVGITPMMAVVRSLTDRCWTGDIYLLFSVRRRAEIIFERELAALQERFPRLHVQISLTGDPDVAWDGARGHLTRARLEALVPDLRGGPILLCGPTPMMTAMRRLLVDELGIPDAEVLEEAFVSPLPGAPAATDEPPTGAD